MKEASCCFASRSVHSNPAHSFHISLLQGSDWSRAICKRWHGFVYFLREHYLAKESEEADLYIKSFNTECVSLWRECENLPFFSFFLPRQHQSLDFKGGRKKYFLLLLLMFPLTGGLIMHHFPFYPAHCVPLSVLSTVSDLKIKAGRRQRCCSLSAGEAFCFSIPPSL